MKMSHENETDGFQGLALQTQSLLILRNGSDYQQVNVSKPQQLEKI